MKRAGDWSCPGCGASVFASKSACFKCGKPRPGGGVAGGRSGGGGRGRRAGPIVPETLRLDLQARLQAFKDDGRESELPLPGLDTTERAWVHEMAPKMGLKSKSRGKKGTDNRVLVVSRIAQTEAERSELVAVVGSLRRAGGAIERALVAHATAGRAAAAKTGRQRAGAARGGNWPPRGGDAATPPPMTAAAPSMGARNALPSRRAAEEVLAAVRAHQVVVLTGETGCGKSTQVPQLLTELAAATAAPCRIVVTQPRRIAAVSLAERVAAETGTRCGDYAGYSVRLNTACSPETHVLYATTGLFLQMLTSRPTVDGITHVILDETHERCKYTDFLLVLLREALPKRPDLRVILMSATMQTDTWLRYFPGCGQVHVTGSAFPVQRHYLGDVLALVRPQAPVAAAAAIAPAGMAAAIEALWLAGDPADAERLFFEAEHALDAAGLPIDAAHPETGVTLLMAAAARGRSDECHTLVARGADPGRLCRAAMDAPALAEHFGFPAVAAQLRSATAEARCREYQETVDDSEVDVELAADLVARLCRDSARPGAILMFMPGHDEIVRTVAALAERGVQGPQHVVLPLHSSCSSREQRAVFKNPPPGVRKVVVATNIAESSITIDDVVFVVDSARHKEMAFDPAVGVDVLMPMWCPQSSLTQRAGRAGRTSEGVCFHLMSRARFAASPEHQPPELLRTPLADLVLSAALLCGPIGLTVRDFLAKAPDAPSPASVAQALDVLGKAGAVDHGTAITQLGRTLSRLSVDVRLAKTALVACTLGCLAPILIIAATASGRDPLLLPMNPRARALATEAHRALGGGSNSWARRAVAVYRAWKASKTPARWAERNYVRHADMCTVEGVCRQLRRQLQEAGVLERPGGRAAFRVSEADADRNSTDWRAVEAAMLAGCGSLSVAVPIAASRASYRTAYGVRALGPTTCPHGHWLHFQSVFRSARASKLNDTTPVPILAVAIFAGKQLEVVPYEASEEEDEGDDDPPDPGPPRCTVVLDGWARITVTVAAAEALSKLCTLWRLFFEEMVCPGVPTGPLAPTVAAELSRLLGEC